MNNNMQMQHDYHDYPTIYQPASDQMILNEPPMQMDCGRRNNWNNNQQNNNWLQNRNMNNTSMMRRSNNMQNLNNMMNQGTGTAQNTISLRPESMTNSDFLPAYLMQYIGKWIRADFLVGNSIEQRVGILEDVGASYIILNAIEPETLIVCDLFAIKFVTIILNDDEYPKLLLV